MKIIPGIFEVSVIQQCKKGNKKAQFELYQQYSKAMYNVAIRITGNRESAQDILQDAFVKAFTDLHDLKDENAFGGWLKRIVINRSIDEIRKRRISFSSLDKLTFEPIEHVEEIEEATDPETVHRLIKLLPDGAREILVLRSLEGLKHTEIAEKLNISESTAKTQFFRAKQLLVKMINEKKDENKY